MCGCLQVKSVPSVGLSCHDVTDAGDVKNESNSFLPFSDANTIMPCDGVEMKPLALFSSPSFASDNDDDDRGSNHVKNIIGMLTADETRSPVRGVNEKTMVDETTETSATWDLDDVDDWLRDQQADVGPVSSLTELHQPSIPQPSAVPLYGKPVVQPPVVTCSGYASYQNSTSFVSSCQYFTQKDMELASSLAELHQPSISQPSAVPLCGSYIDRIQPPAVTLSACVGSQNNMSFTSICQHCHSGKYSISSSAHCPVHNVTEPTYRNDTPSIRTVVVDKERMGQCQWLGLVLCVQFSALKLMVGWLERYPACSTNLQRFCCGTDRGGPEGEPADSGLPGKRPINGSNSSAHCMRAWYILSQFFTSM